MSQFFARSWYGFIAANIDSTRDTASFVSFALFSSSIVRRDNSAMRLLVILCETTVWRAADRACIRTARLACDLQTSAREYRPSPFFLQHVVLVVVVAVVVVVPAAIAQGSLTSPSVLTKGNVWIRIDSVRLFPPDTMERSDDPAKNTEMQESVDGVTQNDDGGYFSFQDNTNTENEPHSKPSDVVSMIQEPSAVDSDTVTTNQVGVGDQKVVTRASSEEEEGALPKQTDPPVTRTNSENVSSWKEHLKEQAAMELQSTMEQMESTTKLLLDHINAYIDSIAQVHESWSAIQEVEHEEAALLEQTERDVERHVQFYHQS